MWPLLVIVFIILFSLAYAASSGAPWVPTWKRDIDRLSRLLELKDGAKFYELGCGDGRVCLELARRHKIFAVGIELSILQWLIANLRRFFSQAHQTKFILGNIFSRDYSEADAVYLFLLPETYEKIRLKLEKELKPGARVVTYVWPIDGWQPIRVDECRGAAKLFLYQR